MMAGVVSCASFFFQTELHTDSIPYRRLLYGIYMSLSVLRRGEMIRDGRCERGGPSYSSTAQNSHALCENALFWMWNRSLNPCVSSRDAGKTALVRHKAPLTNRPSDPLERRKGWLETCGRIFALRVSSGGRRDCRGWACGPLIYLPVSFCLSLRIFRCMAAIYFFIIIMHL